MILKAKSYNLKAISGFSLIEMMVVLTIFGIMTAVVLANFPAFRDKTALDLIAQEIATTIRQAQVYGIGTRAAGAGAAAQFSSHGIYFNLDLTAGGDKKTFILYADTNGSEGYQTSDIQVEKFAIRGSAEISRISGCSDSSCSSPVDLLISNILFQRPYPEANFGAAYSYVKIELQSTRNANQKREIQVWSTGQIVVNDISTLTP